MLERGVCVAGGSDAPIESCSPFLGMFDAIFRQARSTPVVDEETEGEEGSDEPTIHNSAGKARDIDDLSPPQIEVFRPEEALSFAEALWVYTVGAAYAAGCETFLGSLEVGYAADFVIVDAAVLDDHALLATMKPDTVVVGGIISHSRDSGPSDGPLLLCSEIAMAGPYVPGKNGQRPGVKKNKRRVTHGPLGRLSDEPMPLHCACRLLGRFCAATYS
jgi:Amidohydrolase family